MDFSEIDFFISRLGPETFMQSEYRWKPANFHIENVFLNPLNYPVNWKNARVFD